jgi:hypothetical protein
MVEAQGVTVKSWQLTTKAAIENVARRNIHGSRTKVTQSTVPRFNAIGRSSPK